MFYVCVFTELRGRLSCPEASLLSPQAGYGQQSTTEFLRKAVLKWKVLEWTQRLNLTFVANKSEKPCKSLSQDPSEMDAVTEFF